MSRRTGDEKTTNEWRRNLHADRHCVLFIRVIERLSPIRLKARQAFGGGKFVRMMPPHGVYPGLAPLAGGSVCPFNLAATARTRARWFWRIGAAVCRPSHTGPRFWVRHAERSRRARRARPCRVVLCTNAMVVSRAPYLRPMTPVDADAAAALIRRAFAAQPVVLDPPPSALGVTAKAIAEHLMHAGGLVAEVNSRLAGTVLWAREGDACHISRLAVDPMARRQGLASQLLRAAELEARRQGASRLTLGTRLALAGNRRVFAAAGFREIALHSHPGYATPTWVELEKRMIG